MIEPSPPPIVFRPAVPADAAAIAAVTRASIRQLCTEDHRDRADVLDAWLANKTPEAVTGWIADPALVILAADRGGAVVGVGCLGEAAILLNYVAPDHRFQGVSRGMVEALERHARAAGIDTLTLDSTTTARGFYRALGYRDTGPPGAAFGLTSYPMAKPLDVP